METKRAGLGKGLSALISTNTLGNTTSYVENFAIERIVPNPYQPRMHIDPEDLIQMADSIREHGIIQPLIITKDKSSDKHFLIAGERRFRAAQLAGLKKVPVVVKESSPQEMLELALIENIQRKDLNALEEAVAFKQLQDQFGLTHEKIAQKVGLSRVAITNKIRLLSLPDPVKEAVLNHRLSEGHGRALLGITDEMSLVAAGNIVMKRELSVRETEELVRKVNIGKGTMRAPAGTESADLAREWATRLSSKLGYTAQITKMSVGGKITIRYSNDDELEDLMKKMI